jgi:hypothetical protein
MSRHLRLALIVLVAFVGSGRADTEKVDKSEKKKDAPGLREAEVKFTDGSTVRVLMMQETIEVVTKYGKLVVPTNEVRKIDFGMHIAPEIARRIDDAIAKLGSDTFNLREEAGKELVSLGPQAYPALKNAARSKDIEVAARAKTLIEKIKEKFAAGQLRIREEDVIQTSEFTMSGRISSPAIKVRTAYFGDLEVKIGQLRNIRWTAGVSEGAEVVVDATKFGGQDAVWMDTGVTVDTENPLQITAAGQVNLREGVGGNRFMSGPNGRAEYMNQGNGIAHAPGALIGKIGENGNIFVVGEKYDSTPMSEGKLFLQIVQNPWGNQSSGSYKVKVGGGRKEASGE